MKAPLSALFVYANKYYGTNLREVLDTSDPKSPGMQFQFGRENLVDCFKQADVTDYEAFFARNSRSLCAGYLSRFGEVAPAHVDKHSSKELLESMMAHPGGIRRRKRAEKPMYQAAKKVWNTRFSEHA